MEYRRDRFAGISRYFIPAWRLVKSFSVTGRQISVQSGLIFLTNLSLRWNSDQNHRQGLSHSITDSYRSMQSGPNGCKDLRNLELWTYNKLRRKRSELTPTNAGGVSVHPVLEARCSS